VDDETVPREEDELGVAAQDAADEEKPSWRLPAAADEGERRVSAAAETAWGEHKSGRVIAANVALA
jgi:hypothetical protein